jgi:N-acetylneuraminic acid mutarotase
MTSCSLWRTSWLFVWALATTVCAADAPPDSMPYPPLPEAISSFGATTSDGYLYVFGGHAGRLPGNSADGLSPHFVRINLAKPEAGWESLPMHQTSQSPGLVAHGGNLYRVGGLSFKNKAGDDTIFNSLDTFAKYDPAAGKWNDLPSLPIPRSSLDAAVVDGRIYVVGGWNLQAGSAQEAPWHDEALSFDLSKEDSQWAPIAKPPFSTRALATVGHNHKLYALGGMKSTNQTTREVHIYDPQTNAWSAGPELAGGDQLSGFAISAFVDEGKLYYSGSEGIVYRLSEDGTKWESVERLLFPRSFHRLVADKNRVIVVAGVARGGGYLANLEVVDVEAARTSPKVVQFEIEFGGKAKQGQALLLQGSSLYAFGGNNSRAPHDFSKEAFVDEAYRFDMAARTVETLPNLPQPVQGAMASIAGQQIDRSIYVFGGLGFEGDKFSSRDTVYQYRMRSKAWTEEVGHLPATRAMFGTASNRSDVWIFGGSQVNTDDKGLAKTAWIWEPASDRPASVLPDLAIPTPRRSFGGATLNNRYYVAGGLGADSQIIDSASVFDFATQKWADIAAPATPRVFCSLAAAGGKLYLSGGFAKVDGHFQPASTVEVYDPESNKWDVAFERLALKPGATTMIEFQDRLLFYGIDSNRDGVAQFAVVDPVPGATSFGRQPAIGDDRNAGSADMLAQLLKLDKNQDGKLSQDEVGERFQRIIARADADKDGFATKEELEAALKARESRSRNQ